MKQCPGQLSMFSPEASHNLASLSVSPGSEKARTMTVTSGRRWFALLKNSGPVGLLAKMLLESSIWRSTRCCLTWKIRGTPHGRLLFQLAPSTPRTGATGYALLPTLTAADSAQGEVIGENDTFRTTATGTLRKVNRNGTDGSIGLGRLVKLWPTPQAGDYRSPNRNPGSKGGAKQPPQSGHALPALAGGHLNPVWTEWLMGYPAGWTELNV